MKVSVASDTFTPKPHNWLFKITFSFIAGLYTAKIYTFYHFLHYWAGILFILIIVFIINKQNRGLAGFFLFYVLGIILFTIESQKMSTSIKELSGQHVVKIERLLKNTESTLHVKGLVVDSVGLPLLRVVLYITKDGLTKDILPGDVLFCSTVIKPIKDVKIPYAFSPEKYYWNKGITHKAYLHPKSITDIDKRDKLNPFRLAWKCNRKMVESIQKWPGNNKEKEVLIALLTGTKDYLSETTRNAYSDTGIIHVLAVSGLHTGLIYFLVSNVLFTFLGSRYQNIHSLIVIASLWFYALFTGLSPSVIRAATMFTFIQTGIALKRKTGIYHSLCLSALVLLSIKPFILFDIGFQLSYSAVYGIVTTANFFKKIIGFSSSVLFNKLAELVSVSFAAQWFTMPFTIYYFTKFPTLFFVANIYAIPLVTLALFLGLPIAALSFFLPKASYLGLFPSLIIQVNNYLTDLIQRLPYSTIKDIYISDFQFPVLIGFIIFTAYSIVNQKKNYLFVGLILLLIFQINSVRQLYKLSKNTLEIELFSVNENPVIFLKTGTSFGAIIHNKNEEFKEKVSYMFSKYLISKFLKESQIEWIAQPREVNIYFTNNDTLSLQFYLDKYRQRSKQECSMKDSNRESVVLVTLPGGDTVQLNCDGDRIFISRITVDDPHDVVHQCSVFNRSLN